jgi:hypothetical protein
MKIINGGLILIKAKQPFLDWLNGAPLSTPLTLAEVNQDCTAILVPDFNSTGELMAYIEPLKSHWFENELATWNSNQAAWPRNRTSKLFDQWFEVEIHSMVWDAIEPVLQ